MAPIDIRIPAFNIAISALATQVEPPTSTVVAEFLQSINQQYSYMVKSADKISSLANLNTANAFFFVAQTSNFDFSPAFMKVVENPVSSVDAQGNPLSDAGLGMVNDYMKHVSNSKLGNKFQESQFSNLTAIKNDFVAKSAAARAIIQAKFRKISSMGDNPYLVDQDYYGNPNKMFPNLITPLPGDDLATVDAENLGKLILKKLLELAPDRFDSNFPNNGLAFLPIQIGDSLSYTFTINNDDVTVPARQYIIKFRVVANADAQNPGFDQLNSQNWT